MQEQIGLVQDVSAEDPAREETKKSLLCIDWSASSSGINSVKISNTDESNKTIHEIRIDGENRIMTRVLTSLVNLLESMKTKEEQRKSDVEGLQKKRMQEVPLDEYGLKVRTSLYNLEDIFFIIKGIEKDAERPSKIVIENGDFVSVTTNNIRPLCDQLKAIIKQLNPI